MPPRNVPSADWVYIQRVKRKRELEKKAKAAGKVPSSLGNPHHHPNRPLFSGAGNDVIGWFTGFNGNPLSNPFPTMNTVSAHPAAVAVAAAAEPGPSQLPGSFPFDLPDPLPIPTNISDLFDNLYDDLSFQEVQELVAIADGSAAGHSGAHAPATHENGGGSDTAPQATRHQGTQTGDFEEDSWCSRAARAALFLYIVSSGRVFHYVMFFIAIVAICVEIVWILA